jgi:hypothetical protein
LFVSYGGGHISMVLPVALACAERGIAQPEVLALTSAAAASRAAGLKTWQFRDFVGPGDAQSLAWGRELALGLESGGSVETEETQAYLGLSFADLVQDHGEPEARKIYAEFGRHRFLPTRTLKRIFQTLSPDAVVVTNSPRAERAAGLAARELGIPALCLNSMFAIDEIAWLGQPGFCDRICVLNPGVRQRFISAGRGAHEVVVTGNPSFDPLFDPVLVAQGLQMRQSLGPNVEQVVLWASQPEYVSHPTAPGLVGDPQLPLKILDQMLRWAAAGAGRHLIVRSHPNETLPDPGVPYATLVQAKAYDVAVNLHACDVMATMTSTVALQGHALGVPVLQVRGSIFDHSMPLKQMGIAQECAVHAIVPALEAIFSATGSRTPAQQGLAQGHLSAAQEVAEQIALLLRAAPRGPLK